MLLAVAISITLRPFFRPPSLSPLNTFRVNRSLMEMETFEEKRWKKLEHGTTRFQFLFPINKTGDEGEESISTHLINQATQIQL